jgi:anti-sigma regulatory factor (Ser/Thr protein kinase)
VCGSTPSAQLLLPSSESSPAAARDWARRAVCVEHALSVQDEALLLITELITNSVRHGGPPIVLALECDEHVLRARVRDGSPTLPTPITPSLDSDEGGRGMTLVSLLTDTWGVEPVEDEHGPGKQIWFELRATS